MKIVIPQLSMTMHFFGFERLLRVDGPSLVCFQAPSHMRNNFRIFGYIIGRSEVHLTPNGGIQNETEDHFSLPSMVDHRSPRFSIQIE